MPAYYDYYDYPAYWKGREYEHASEEEAIKTLIAEVPKIKTACEIGAGYGRLIPTYLFRAKKVVVTDPSAKLLSIAQHKYRNSKNVFFFQSSLENIKSKVNPRSLDLIVMVRVLHHMQDLDSAIKTISSLLGKNGYLILEFANKVHFKAAFSELAKGNLGFSKDVSPKDVRSKRNQNSKTLPFFNYHPEVISEKLKAYDFQIIDKLSVSNFRSPFLKKYISNNTLVFFEKYLQKPLSYVNFGPSIFVLAKKTA